MPVFWLRSYSLNSPSALWLEGEVFTSCRVLSHISTSCFISYCGEGWFSAASRTTFEYLSTRRFENFLAESNSVYLPSLPGSDLKSGFNFTRKTKKEKEGKKITTVLSMHPEIVSRLYRTSELTVPLSHCGITAVHCHSA